MTLQLATSKNNIEINLKPWQTGINRSFDASDIKTKIKEAIGIYSSFKPVRAFEDFSFTAGVKEYSWPTGTIRVHPMRFSDSEISLPSISEYTILNGGILLFPFSGDTIDPNSIANLNRARAYSANISEVWLGSLDSDSVRRKFFIHPEPTEDMTRKILVDRYHEVNGGSDDYLTIPDEDVYQIECLATGKLLMVLAAYYAAQDGKTGDRDTRGGNIYKNLKDLGIEYQEEFYSKFRMMSGSRT